MDFPKPDSLTKFTIAVYSTGHVLNDLCAACWFNFLLYYLVSVEGVSNSTAGAVLLAGQVADGIATPLVGIYSDRFETRFGKRKLWYIIGTLIVPLCFFFIWQTCYPCLGMSGSGEQAFQIFWYSLFAALFNVGWASTQVAHLSMIPSLTPVKKRRNLLIGLRTAFTYLSNVAVLAISLVLFNIIPTPQVQFIVLSILVLCLGGALSVVFIIFIDERKLTQKAIKRYRTFQATQELGADPTEVPLVVEMPNSPALQESIHNFTWRQWLKKMDLYPVGAVYMLARLANNVYSSTLPFYLTTVLAMGGVSSPSEGTERTPWQLAVVPLILYITSVTVSVNLEKLGKRYSRRRQYFFGCLLVSCGSIPMLFLTRDVSEMMFLFAVFEGAGLALLLNNSVGFVTDFVKMYGSSSGFVWGGVSFCDKFGSGIVLFIITVRFMQNAASLGDELYVRIVASLVPIVASATGAALTILLRPQDAYTISRTVSNATFSSELN